MYLDDLFKELNVTDTFDKKVLCALVFECLRSNNCGLNKDNTEDVKKVISEGICSDYELGVLGLATYWSNDLACMLCSHIGLPKDKDIFKDYIWKYISEREVVAEVRMVTYGGG